MLWDRAYSFRPSTRHKTIKTRLKRRGIRTPPLEDGEQRCIVARLTDRTNSNHESESSKAGEVQRHRNDGMTAHKKKNVTMVSHALATERNSSLS